MNKTKKRKKNCVPVIHGNGVGSLVRGLPQAEGLATDFELSRAQPTFFVQFIALQD